jgi:branched-chain amino acid transport system substrate-binding protein
MLGTTPFSDTMIPVAQIAQPYGVSIFQPQSTQVEMHAGIVDNFFTGVSPDPFTATAAANHALSEGVKNVVLLTSDEGGSWSARTPLWFGQVIEEGGGKVLAKMNFSFGTSDWSPQIADMKALGEEIDAVYISSIMPDIGVLVRQLRSAGIDAWVVGSDGFDDPSLDAVAADDPAILDKVFFATLAPSHDESAVVKFMADCKELGHDVPGLFPATGADTVKAVAWAVETSGSSDPAVIAETIRTADTIPVLTVDSISFKDTKTYAQRTIPVIGYKDGKRVLISNEIPENTPKDWN